MGPAPRYDGGRVDDALGRPPLTPATTRYPPEYDRTWASDQAAAQEREYAEWRRAVEDSIRVHRENKLGQLYKLEEKTAANSTMESKPVMKGRVIPLTPSQEAARKAIPKELPVFSGNVEQWPLFIATYERSTILCWFSDDENLIRLQGALRGPALELVDHLMLLPDGLAGVVEILRTKYGRPDLIVDSLVEKVRRLPPVRSDRLETLATFGKMVRKMCATIEASGLHDYDCNVTLLRELIAKLPAERSLEWARYKIKLSRETIKEFDKWIYEIAVAASVASKTIERSLEVQLQISGIHDGAVVYELRTVHTLEDLKLPTQTMQIEKLVQMYPHLKRIPIASYTDVMPRVLIGVDNIHLGKPSRCVEGGFDEPIAA
uniref:Uncharacterized protein n=1 Tax=Anopheles funestus TaxID=62324 RepID=A0A182RWV2_ANOFN